MHCVAGCEKCTQSSVCMCVYMYQYVSVLKAVCISIQFRFQIHSSIKQNCTQTTMRADREVSCKILNLKEENWYVKTRKRYVRL
jgi:hypothetical protein